MRHPEAAIQRFGRINRTGMGSKGVQAPSNLDLGYARPPPGHTLEICYLRTRATIVFHSAINLPMELSHFIARVWCPRRRCSSSGGPLHDFVRQHNFQKSGHIIPIPRAVPFFANHFQFRFHFHGRDKRANSIKATVSDNTIIIAGKPTPIPDLRLAVMPTINRTIAPSALHPLNCRGSTFNDTASESGISRPKPTNPTGIARTR